ncbi:hypothetical protein BDZ89DRAFT_1039996 [Hymenopellis radicata]|nr:hypothetical protein BDZ89DRAFT_1039996 [Hymenopellis radicata]
MSSVTDSGEVADADNEASSIASLVQHAARYVEGVPTAVVDVDDRPERRRRQDDGPPLMADTDQSKDLEQDIAGNFTYWCETRTNRHQCMLELYAVNLQLPEIRFNLFNQGTRCCLVQIAWDPVSTYDILHLGPVSLGVDGRKVQIVVVLHLRKAELKSNGRVMREIQYRQR